MSDDRCNDCGRLKAHSADDAMRGCCPKWHAVRDKDAAKDCADIVAHVRAAGAASKPVAEGAVYPDFELQRVWWNNAQAEPSIPDYIVRKAIDWDRSRPAPAAVPVDGISCEELRGTYSSEKRREQEPGL